MTKQFKIGDKVHFKSDVEQWGRIVKIIPPQYRGDSTQLVLKPCGETFTGDYIGGDRETVIYAEDTF